MCFGELRPIHPERRNKEDAILFSIHPRDPALAYEESERARERFIKLASNLTWGLTSGLLDPLTGGPEGLIGGWQGLTLSDPITGSIRGHLSIDKIEPLLRTDLLVSSARWFSSAKVLAKLGD